jgi:hypothetical protein
MSSPDNTEQTPIDPSIYDSDVFTGEDLERASAIFKKYYPDRTLESIQADRSDSNEIDLPELQESLTPAPTRSDRQAPSIRISARELHKYPIGLVGIFMMFLISYPISMSRVSQAAKFAPYGAHLKSLTPEYRQSEVK